MGIFNQKDKLKEGSEQEALPTLNVGVTTLQYTSTEPIDLDASMVEVFETVKLEPGQKVMLPTMLARHWLKKPFFVVAE
jgi:hypothetical protein